MSVSIHLSDIAVMVDFMENIIFVFIWRNYDWNILNRDGYYVYYIFAIILMTILLCNSLCHGKKYATAAL